MPEPRRREAQRLLGAIAAGGDPAAARKAYGSISFQDGVQGVDKS
jgi:hypothetical protein